MKPDGLVLLLLSDHRVEDAVGFRAMVEAAVPAATAGSICLTGIAPDRPETGYGYIQVGDEAVPDAASSVRRVAHFVEKPDADGAGRLLAAGDAVWNAGIFLLQASVLRTRPV